MEEEREQELASKYRDRVSYQGWSLLEQTDRNSLMYALMYT